MAYAKIINALYSGQEFTIYGDGEQLRSNTYIDDIVDATILAEENESKLLIMNICGDEVVSLNNAIIILEKLTENKLIKLNMPGRIGDQRDTSGNSLKAKELLGWQSKVRIEIGLQNQVEAFKNSILKP
jgi:UDP-glucose 4-epimerase